MCSLHLICISLPDCPTYSLSHVMHLILYIPLGLFNLSGFLANCSFMGIFTISCAISVEFFTVYVLGSGNRMYNCQFSCFAILCDCALTLFTTGLIGISSLCVFMCALSCGVLGFTLITYLCFLLSIIPEHCAIVFCICF